MATVYVTKQGSDANSGASWALPKLTAGGAISASSADDTLYFGAGTWTENITFATNREYKGQGMFLTTINGTLSTGSSSGTLKFTSLKHVLSASMSSTALKTTLLQITDCFFDSNGYTLRIGATGAAGALKIIRSVINGGTSSSFFIQCDGSGVGEITKSVLYTSSSSTPLYFQGANTTLKDNFFGGTNNFWNTILAHTYNAYIATPTWGLGTGEFVTTAAACFRDPVGGDFTLAAGSPLLGTGIA